VEILRSNDHHAVFAGGCVRDMVMGIHPQDVDVATDAAPDRVQRIFYNTIPVGESFGVVIVRMAGMGYEVATFRKEGPYEDGRRPKCVSFVTQQEDVKRRDFTCNGLLYDPLTETLLDFVQGRGDIEKRRLRAIGDPVERFEEDHLRLLRAIRFSIQLDFWIETSTWEAILKQRKGIRGVSRERIKEELFKLLSLSGRGKGLRLLLESNLANQVLPDLFQGYDPLPGLRETCDILNLLRDFHPETSLAAILRLRPFPLRERRDHLMRMRLSAKEAGQVMETLEILDVLPGILDQPLCRRKRLYRKACFTRAMDLFRAVCETTGEGQATWLRIHEEARGMGPEELFPRRWFTGDDLLAMGFEEGKGIGILLEGLEDEQLEGRARSPEEALRWLRRRHV